ncbi:MAG: hypothetical protein ACE5DN_07100 [Flavobacteriales bacterium]
MRGFRSLCLLLLLSSGCSKFELYDDSQPLPPLPLIETRNTVMQLPVGSDPRYAYYDKYINAYADDYKTGIPIISTEVVADDALKSVRATAIEILSANDGLRRAMALNGGLLVIVGEGEGVSDHIALNERVGSTTSMSDSGVCYFSSNINSDSDESVGAVARLIYRAGLADYDSLLYTAVSDAVDSAKSNGIFHADNSLSATENTEAYFIIGTEVWFGLWQGHPSAGDGSYDIVSRTLMEAKDSALFNVLRQIYKEADIDPCN